MIFLDSDVLLIDLRYQRDPRFDENRRLLDRLQSEKWLCGLTTSVMLEVIGVMSFSTSSRLIERMPEEIQKRFGLGLYPDPAREPDFAGCTFDELMTLLQSKMSLGDAIHAAQLLRYSPANSILITWNQKDYVNRLRLPALTPAEWLANH